eukprot:10744847-Lingulodinium_polyedra.AAC.1
MPALKGCMLAIKQVPGIDFAQHVKNACRRRNPHGDQIWLATGMCAFEVSSMLLKIFSGKGPAP